jgi:hypothetical protein
MEIETIEGELWELSSQLEMWQHRRHARASISDAEKEVCGRGNDVATCSGARRSVKAHCMRSTSVGIVRLSSYARFETCSKRAGSFVHPRLCVCKEGTLSRAAAGVGHPHSDNPNPGGTAYWRRFRMEPIRGVGSGGGGASDSAGAVGDNETAAENGAAGGGDDDDDNEPSTLYLVHEEFGPEGSDVPTAVHVRVANTGSHDACVVVRRDASFEKDKEPMMMQVISTSLLPAVRTVPAGQSVAIGTFGSRDAAAMADNHDRQQQSGFPLRFDISHSGNNTDKCDGSASSGNLWGNIKQCPEPQGPFLLEDATRRDTRPNTVVYESPIRQDAVLVEARALSKMARTERNDGAGYTRLMTCRSARQEVFNGVVSRGYGGILAVIAGLSDAPSLVHPRRVCEWHTMIVENAAVMVKSGIRELDEL